MTAKIILGGQDIFTIVHGDGSTETFQDIYNDLMRGVYMTYEYGKDYKNNGSKPNIGPGILLHLTYADSSCSSRLSDSGIDWHLAGVSSDIAFFRIVDERYKPKADELNWYRHGELPPIGSYVDVVGEVRYGAGEVNCEVLSHVEDTAVIRMSYGLGCFESRVLRPSNTERDLLVKKALSLFDKTEATTDALEGIEHAVNSLIDANWRPIKQQSEIEFAAATSVYYDEYYDEEASRSIYRAGCRFVEQGD